MSIVKPTLSKDNMIFVAVRGTGDVEVYLPPHLAKVARGTVRYVVTLFCKDDGSIVPPIRADKLHSGWVLCSCPPSLRDINKPLNMFHQVALTHVLMNWYQPEEEAYKDNESQHFKITVTPDS